MAWTTPRTWQVLEQLTAALMNEQVRDNEVYLKARVNIVTECYAENKQSTTSTSYVDVTDSSKTWTATVTGKALIVGSANCYAWAPGAQEDILITDNNNNQLGNCAARSFSSEANGLRDAVPLSTVISVIAGNSYTAKLRFKVSGNTGFVQDFWYAIVELPSE